ncbi:MAG: undecaprenyl-diphosphatase [Neolewinella sp.]|jgi:undecaprenyl-diphosphatase
MLEFLKALVLGIIQGLTEFLPVSSSGHLELAKWVMQDDSLAAESMLMTVTLHAATALATILVFRKDIAEILMDLLKFKWNDGTKFAALIVASMIPAAIIGVLFDDVLEALFDRQIVLVAIMLIVTGLLLFLADGAKNTEKTVDWKDAVIIGLAQAVAILPGISRSGATISTSVMLGIDREKSARFSFLMVVPLILGKMAKDVMDGEFSGTASLPELGIGFIAAFLTGIVACVWMIKLVKKAELKWFAYYCFAVAAVVLAWKLFS